MNYRDIALIVLFLVAWVVLNRFVLPACGISTCMSGGCAAGCCSSAQESPSPTAAKSQSPLLDGSGAQSDERQDGPARDR